MNQEYSLTPEQKRFYNENGYLLGLHPIYTREEMRKLTDDLPQLMALLRPGETPKDIREWHETSRWLFDICMNPKIHDLVEGVKEYSWFIVCFFRQRDSVMPHVDY